MAFGFSLCQGAGVEVAIFELVLHRALPFLPAILKISADKPGQNSVGNARGAKFVEPRMPAACRGPEDGNRFWRWNVGRWNIRAGRGLRYLRRGNDFYFHRARREK